jgi:hypothetical protein
MHKKFFDPFAFRQAPSSRFIGRGATLGGRPRLRRRQRLLPTGRRGRKVIQCGHKRRPGVVVVSLIDQHTAGSGRDFQSPSLQFSLAM